ncbi:MAG: sucrase ferredoxin [Cyanobacteria bacterium P01_F01_bin.53]
MATDMPTDRLLPTGLPMSPIQTQACQYCSVASKANGEDPIGTAVTAQQWLFIEVPQPWAKNPWVNQSATLLALFQQIERQPRLWSDLRILAIAPDKIESTASKRHVFFYQKPQGAIAAYDQQHYHVPTEQLPDLVQALIFKPHRTDYFSQYHQPPARALFVCTHTSYDLACGRFGTPLYRTLREHYAQPATSASPLSVWQTTHFGGHHFAPTLIDFPTGQFWGHLEPEVLDTLVHRRGDVTELARFYRGWSGWGQWAQIAERAIWMRQGWGWLTTPKSARIVRQDLGPLHQQLLRWILAWIPTIRAKVLLKKLQKKLTWAEVEICWETSQGAPSGRYHARVEVSHQVLSQMRSGAETEVRPSPQFQVSEVDIAKKQPV